MKQTGRYELKYVIEEDRAVAVADYVRTFLRPSEHNGTGPVRGHPVISLYMDSPDYFLYRQAFFGHRNRMKLRIRFYDEHWNRPAFLEIKRRVNDIIVKDRAMIGREEVRQFLAGGWPNPSHWPDPGSLKKGKKQLDVYFRYWQFCAALKAKPIAYLSYLREIYEMPHDDEMRVTLDRCVAATPYDESTMLNEDIGKLIAPLRGVPSPPDKPPYFVPYNGVVLELKFEERAPCWLFDLIRIFNLKRRDMCKYAAAVEGMMLPWGKPHLPEDNHALSLCGYD
jgi:SPX domain protein involved in polyphosphate accumulation